jgi:NADPH:quinone reductase-like Zn-dependent oxidoreductase
MTAVRAAAFGGPELAGLERVAAPGRPAAGEVLVRVEAAGIALPDLLLLAGMYPGMRRDLPHPVGIEYAGVIEELGSDVASLQCGDRVCGMVYPPQGAASELLVVRATDVARLPDALSPVEGAAVPSAFATAHVVLHRQGALRIGERVLVLAGASGLGLAAIGMARQAGAEVYAAASPAKLEALRAAGAVEAFDSTSSDWVDRLPPMDLILDPIGGESFVRSYKLLAPGGRLACVDATSRHPAPGERYARQPGDLLIDPFKLIIHAKSVLGIDMPALWARDGGQAPLLHEALAHLESGELRPTVAEVLPFRETAAALALVQDRKVIGRVVVTPG